MCHNNRNEHRNIYCIMNNKIIVFVIMYIFRYFKSAKQKTTFLCLTMMINGLIMTVLPFMRNFALLVTARCLQNIARHALADKRLDGKWEEVV